MLGSAAIAAAAVLMATAAVFLPGREARSPARAADAPNRVVLPQLASGESGVEFAKFRARDQSSSQRDRCGSYIIERVRKSNPPLFDLLGAPDDVVIYDAQLRLLLTVPGPQRVSPFGDLFVDWCFDLDSDGTPELAISDWSGDTGPASLTVYSLGSPVRVRWQFDDERVLGTAPLNVDGTLPYELIGSDGRFQLLATSKPAGPVPPFVVRLTPNGAAPAPEYRWIFEAYRNREFERLSGCSESWLDDQCGLGAILGIMVASLTIGDWDDVRLNAAIRPDLRDRIELCRDRVAAAVADFNTPFNGSFLGCFG
ncbi:MAG: hypothetical protein HYX53_06365 [Chloroflexi bacterium]|nr:hypothetical protein [Chloroflexota bacterium]